MVLAMAGGHPPKPKSNPIGLISPEPPRMDHPRSYGLFSRVGRCWREASVIAYCRMHGSRWCHAKVRYVGSECELSLACVSNISRKRIARN